VAQDKHIQSDNASTQAPSPEPEGTRQERLAQLVLRRSKLSASEVLLLDEVFHTIVTSHYDRVWNWLRKRGLSSQEAEDLLQDAFLELYTHILEEGFPANLPGKLRTLTELKLLNHLRARRSSLESIGLPSSGSEKPRSGPDAERAVAICDLARRLIDQLSPELQSVVEKVMLNGLTHRDAAAVLDLPEGTVKSRVIAAKRDLLALAERMLPPSQRDAL
jgi:RNA polymerase sigma-70 factor, ECF subfamily